MRGRQSRKPGNFARMTVFHNHLSDTKILSRAFICGSVMDGKNITSPRLLPWWWMVRKYFGERSTTRLALLLFFAPLPPRQDSRSLTRTVPEWRKVRLMSILVGFIASRDLLRSFHSCRFGRQAVSAHGPLEGREGVKWELGLALKWDLLTGTGI